MKKYIVCFKEKISGAKSQKKVVLAESKEEARDKYLVENYSEKHELIEVISPEFSSTPQVCDNPIYYINKKEIIEADQKLIHNEDFSQQKFAIENKNRSANIQSDKLDRLIELQEKQLYWIRIVGIPFLMAAIGTFLSLLISALKGGR